MASDQIPEQVIADAIHECDEFCSAACGPRHIADDYGRRATAALRAAGLLVAPGEVPVPIDALRAYCDLDARAGAWRTMLPPHVVTRLDSAPSD